MWIHEVSSSTRKEYRQYKFRAFSSVFFRSCIEIIFGSARNCCVELRAAIGPSSGSKLFHKRWNYPVGCISRTIGKGKVSKVPISQFPCRRTIYEIMFCQACVLHCLFAVLIAPLIVSNAENMPKYIQKNDNEKRKYNNEEKGVDKAIWNSIKDPEDIFSKFSPEFIKKVKARYTPAELITVSKTASNPDWWYTFTNSVSNCSSCACCFVSTFEKSLQSCIIERS